MKKHCLNTEKTKISLLTEQAVASTIKKYCLLARDTNCVATFYFYFAQDKN